MQCAIETTEQGTFGPFRDDEAAVAWALDHVKGNWTLVKLREPAGLADADDGAGESGELSW